MQTAATHDTPVLAAVPAEAKNGPTLHVHDDTTDGRHRGGNLGHELADNKPTTPAVFCKVELPDTPVSLDHYGKPVRREVEIHSWGDHIFLGFSGWTGMEGENLYAKEADPFVTVERISDAYVRQVTRDEWQADTAGHNYGRGKNVKVVVDSTYNHPDGSTTQLAVPKRTRYGHQETTQHVLLQHQWLRFRFTLEDGTTFEAEFAFEMPTTGKATVADDGSITCESEFHGATRTWTHETLKQRVETKNRNYGGSYTERNNPLGTLLQHMRDSDCTDGIERWWTVFLSHQPDAGTPDTKGLSSVLKKKANKACFETLAADHPVEWALYCWLMSGKTRDKQQNNKFLRAVFEECGFDPAKIAAEATKLMSNPGNVRASHGYREGPGEIYFDSRRALCQNFSVSAEVIRVIEAKTDFRKRKTNAGKADGLGIDADRYPKLRAAVEASKIPAGVFANPNGNPLNREYALWEKALNQKGWAEPVYSIAQDAARRSTYEKDVTPYLAFLFKLGPYLDRHTPGRKKWTCFPSYVESEWQLEMGDDGEGFANGTVKRRSAFTPVADNDTRVVTVPYVAVCVTGRVSQWCYSKEYYVFEEMMIDPISKGVVVNEVEQKLNGRDDYGLMFYTLNGSATAQGYPTFLIIFERRTEGGDNTFVHFHRVHPKRKSNGLWTPACDLIAKTYQYMVGNVPAADVRAQQGDMVYILHGNDPLAAGAKVEDTVQAARQLNFESHNHCALGDKGEIKLHVSTAKTPKNRLGFMQVPEGGMAVRHPEHDDINYLEAGWYEVRRCRSWEANPVAIWSLTID